jgi:hypothetical protein
MLLSLLLPVWNFLKKYLIIIGLIIAVLLFGKWSCDRIKYLETDNARKTENIKNKDFEISIEKTKSGQLEYTVASLTVKPEELKYFSKNIEKQLADMGLKIKNIQSITNLNYNYTTNIDTIKSKMVAENKFLFAFPNKNNMDISGYINIPKKYPDFEIPTDFSIIDTTKNAKYPFISDLKITINDTLLIVPVYQYKRSWIFWKKFTGVELHIKSENPNFKLDRVQSYQISK